MTEATKPRRTRDTKVLSLSVEAGNIDLLDACYRDDERSKKGRLLDEFIEAGARLRLGNERVDSILAKTLGARRRR